MERLKIFVGWDPRFSEAYHVAVKSLLHCSPGIKANQISPVCLFALDAAGLYTRPTSVTPDGNLWDEISEAPMSTEFAISRFFVPYLSGFEGWSLFLDSDFVFRADIADLEQYLDESKAFVCVKHDQQATDGVKMDGQTQTDYPRKNWSSFMLINNGHPAVKAMYGSLNRWPGRLLHAFADLPDDRIGELPAEWNWLEGYSDPTLDPKAIHYTRGTPDVKGYEDVPFADYWRQFTR